MTAPFDSVLLVGFGGPPRAEDAVEFVRGTLGARGTEERIRAVAHHYELVGGSPFNALTIQQAEALGRELERRGLRPAVRVGFKNWTPFIAETLADMAAKGLRNSVGVVMAPHRCWASDDKYRDAVEEGRRQVGPAAPAVSWIDFFGQHYQYVKAEADLIRGVADRIGPERWAKARLVFTAHSVPINGCGPCTNRERTCPYPTEYRQTAELVAAELGRPDFVLAYQSRAETRRPWLEPDVSEVIRTLAAQGVPEVVLAPIGFLCDHVEVLFDLEIEARKTADSVGVAYHRAGTVQDHPRFISLLADSVEAKLRGQMPV